MYNLTVQSLPLKEVIKDIAKCLDTDFVSICGLYRVTIPEKYGEGFVEGVDFGDGFGMINYHCQFNEKTIIKFTLAMVHPIKFLYCYDGSFTHKFAKRSDEAHHVQRYENLIVASQYDNGHILIFDKDEPIRICSIEINREEFLPKVGCLINEISHDGLVKTLIDREGKSHFYYNGRYSLEIANIIEEVQRKDRIPLVEHLFKNGKSYEILTLQMEQYYEDKNQTDTAQTFRQTEYDKINKLTKYIVNNITKPITIEMLERESGYTSKKLQQLFQKMYNNTVNNYIQTKRLEIASKLISNTDKNVSEVAYAVGISSKSYFSKVFKEKYGISPSYYLKQVRSNNFDIEEEE